jgi:hypothetical protein
MDFDLFKAMFKSTCIRLGRDNTSISNDKLKWIYEDYRTDRIEGIPLEHAMNIAVYYNT